VKRWALAALLLTAACNEKKQAPAEAPGGGSPAAAAPRPGPMMARALEGQELYAIIRTTMGDVTVRLFSKDAPKTVANFVGLATGEREFTDAKTSQKTKRPYYDGTIFHRVIPDFMIQGGDQTGTGRGDPGYRFEDEFSSGRKFDKVGLLAMANAGPATNGSQFFITTSTPTWLSGKHTIFGEVIAGYEVVEAISKVPRGPADRPTTEVKIQKLEVLDKAP
jgi:peptidyl-prolyl cis-trans isomerase A (cyclophilin A)